METRGTYIYIYIMTLASSDIPLRPRCLYEMELHTLANVSDLAVPAS